jgi:hypothetical protein
VRADRQKKLKGVLVLLTLNDLVDARGQRVPMRWINIKMLAQVEQGIYLTLVPVSTFSSSL